MKTRIISPQDLTRREREQMLRLMTAHYDDVKPDAFFSDLLAKDVVIVLETDRIVGFSTQRILKLADITAVFSGDTIIERAHWGTQHLSQAFARYFFDHPEGVLDWFLISKGFKTYRFLPTFFREFYPRYDQPTPPEVKARLDALGSALFPEDYDPVSGVIEYRGVKDRLKADLQELSVRQNDPNYQFFITANPGFSKGHDLACLTRLSCDNLREGRARLLFGEEK
ncbi:MAG TPA: hypothetical protein GXZ74_06440 [Tissierellia bacterium]|nr:hypothetical protein [Tissierellia bacterium]